MSAEIKKQDFQDWIKRFFTASKEQEDKWDERAPYTEVRSGPFGYALVDKNWHPKMFYGESFRQTCIDLHAKGRKINWNAKKHSLFYEGGIDLKNSVTVDLKDLRYLPCLPR